ncbi:MAG: ABC transporter permease [Propioniciclava sp.]
MAEADVQRWRERRRRWLTVLASIVLALLIGAILMIISDPEVIGQYQYLFTAPALPLGASWVKVSSAYSALFIGAVGSPTALASTAWQAAPLICAGLGVGLAFRAGLFNIGAQGQAIWGSVAAAYVGFAWELPAWIHLPLAILAGILAGGVWGGIVGFLKARTGAHEVIVTIMMNFIAAGSLTWLLLTPAFLRPNRIDPLAPPIHSSAAFPILYGQLTVGFLVALLAAALTWWLLDRSTIGFAIRAVGTNPQAAGTAGMSVGATTIIAMAVSGALAGLAGVQYALSPGADGFATPLSTGLVATVGFDAITVALLGRSRPGGIVLAGLLFGGLHSGGLTMMSRAQTPDTLTMVLQALIVLFVAAPAIVTALMPKVRPPAEGALAPGAA